MKKQTAIILVFLLVISSICMESFAQSVYPAFTVDYSQKSGPLKHGAAGFLYGLGSDNSPYINTLTPLKPHTAVQKAPDGLQHPTGDVLDTAKTFIYSGGKYVQIYLQDIYALWPYEYTSFNDYLEKIREMVPKIKALRESDENFTGKFVYIPFNEPDGIWYQNINSSTSVQNTFNQNWLSAYTLIKSLDPDALIGGISFASYQSNAFDSFLKFCSENNCYPEIITWHELQTDKLNSFASHLSHFRSLEQKYNLPRREIVINEYAPQDHVSVPGKLVNWIALFEENKVSACLPYWHNAGNLNDLAADNNEPNGAWWLYKWYGDMSGETLKVESSTDRTQLYGLASLDENKKVSNIIFGGIGGTSKIVLKNLDKTQSFKDAKAVNVKIEATHWTAFHGVSMEPEIVQMGTYKVTGGEVIITLENMEEYSAYNITVTSANEADETGVIYNGRWRKTYEAENATLVGRASKTSDPWTYAKSGGYRVNMMDSQNDGFDMKVNVPMTGLYKMDIVYGNGFGLNTSDTTKNNPQTVKHTLSIDNSEPKILVLENTLRWQMSGLYSEYIYLTEGGHTLSFRGALDTPQGASMDCVTLTYVGKDMPVFDKIYEAELADFNTLNGKTQTPVTTKTEIPDYSGSGYITGLNEESVPDGCGVRFTVVVDKGGLYNLSLRYNSQNEGQFNIYLDNNAITLNNKLTELPIKATPGWGLATKTVYLQKGINIIDIDSTADCALDYLRVKKAADDEYKTQIEAESQTLDGNAKITNNAYASGGAYVSNIQGGTADALTLTVTAPKEGLYKLEIYFSNSELFGAHDYNAQIVDRYASFKVNGNEPVRLYFKNTYSDENFRPYTLPVYLNEGENSIKIYNDNYRILRCGTGTPGNITYHTLVNYTPNFDKFIIYPAYLDTALSDEGKLMLKVYSTSGGKVLMDKNYAQAGESVSLFFTPDYEESKISVRANSTDISSLIQKEGGIFKLTYQVNSDTTFYVAFENPENMDKYIKNSSFGFGDLSYFEAEGSAAVESDEENRLSSKHYLKLDGGKITQSITGIEDGIYSLFVYAKGNGSLTLLSGDESKTYVVSDKYQRYEMRVFAQNNSLSIGAQAQGVIYLDDFSLSNEHIDSAILYFVDCGDSNPYTLSEGDKFGIYNSVTEQFYGKDPVTGKYWGVVDDYTPNETYPTLLTGRLTWPYEYDLTDGRSKVVSYRYAKDQDNMNPKPGITYKFELPNGEYTIETAYYAPSSWMGGNVNRKSHVTINGETVQNSIIPTTNPESPIILLNSAKVTGGFLTYNISLDPDGYGGPMVNYIIIREKVLVKREYIPVDLSNKVITGTPSWNNVPTTVAQYAFDGNNSTFFDGLVGGYCQVDLGEITDISQIGYVPRDTYANRMVGGMFLASKDGENWVKLYVIPTAPPYYTETKVTADKFLSSDTMYRYIRYTCLLDYANVSEIKIYKNADFLFDVINLNPQIVSVNSAYIENNKAYISHTSQGDVTFIIAKYKDNKLESVTTKKAASPAVEIPLPDAFDKNCAYKLFVWDLKSLFPYTKLAS